jgi:hypothetical protein
MCFCFKKFFFCCKSNLKCWKTMNELYAFNMGSMELTWLRISQVTEISAGLIVFLKILSSGIFFLPCFFFLLIFWKNSEKVKVNIFGRKVQKSLNFIRNISFDVFRHHLVNITLLAILVSWFFDIKNKLNFVLWFFILQKIMNLILWCNMYQIVSKDNARLIGGHSFTDWGSDHWCMIFFRFRQMVNIWLLICQIHMFMGQ